VDKYCGKLLFLKMKKIKKNRKKSKKKENERKWVCG